MLYQVQHPASNLQSNVGINLPVVVGGLVQNSFEDFTKRTFTDLFTLGDASAWDFAWQVGGRAKKSVDLP
jgi:hypothetical protein